MRNFVMTLMLVVSLLLVGACQTPTTVSSDTNSIKYWPAPPEMPRYEYEITIHSNLSIHRESEDSLVRRLLTGTNAIEHKMIKPYYVAARYGRIYISDTALNQIHVFDLARKRYFRLGYRREGALSDPRGLTVSDTGHVYVVDRTLRKIFIYDTFGLYLQEIKIDESIIQPTAIAVNSDLKLIYLLDSGGISSNSHRIIMYDFDGNQVGSFGSRGGAPGEFNLPNALAINSQGNIYVLDAGNFRVQVFNATGNFLSSWGKVGNGLGDFSRPRGLAIDPQDLVYVSDTSFTNIQIFSSEGKLLLPIGKRSYADKNGAWSLVAGIAFDERNHLYVIDQAHKKLEIFRKLTEDEGRQILLAEPDKN